VRNMHSSSASTTLIARRGSLFMFTNSAGRLSLECIVVNIDAPKQIARRTSMDVGKVLFQPVCAGLSRPAQGGASDACPNTTDMFLTQFLTDQNAALSEPIQQPMMSRKTRELYAIRGTDFIEDVRKMTFHSVQA